MKKIILALLMFFIPVVTKAKPPVFTDNYKQSLELTQELGLPIVLIFGADWCKYCVVQKKDLWANLELLNDMIIVPIDIDESPQVAHEYGIRKVPTTVFLLNKTEKARKNGYSNLKDFKAWLKNLPN